MRDAEGREYLDCIAGIATVALGHCHPALVRALEEQARTLWHVSNLFYNPRAVELAEALAATTSWAKRVFLCNSGAESNEAMLKLARKFHADQGHPERHEIVACLDSFHGRTMFALAATGQPKYHHRLRAARAGREARPVRRPRGPRGGARAEDGGVHRGADPGEAGVMPAPAGYLAKARELTRRAGALLCLDEVQTDGPHRAHLGARVGGRRARSHVVRQGARERLPDGRDARDGGGRGAPLARQSREHLRRERLGAAVALATLAEIRRVLLAALATSTRLVERLDALRAGGRVAGVRGRGMLVGVVLSGVDAGEVVTQARAHGLLVNAIGSDVVRLAPALTLTAAEADLAAERLAAAIAAAPAKT